MSREEAIETLKLLKPNMRFDDLGWLYTKQALEMAIQALSQEPCDDAISREAVLEGLKGCICEEWIKTLFATMVKQLPSVNPQPCDDAISLKTVIEWLKAKDIIKLSSQEERARQELKALPSVTQKSGKWNEYYTSQKGNDVFNCKECGHTFVVTQGKDNMNYCPNCGAKMESEE